MKLNKEQLKELAKAMDESKTYIGVDTRNGNSEPYIYINGVNEAGAEQRFCIRKRALWNEATDKAEYRYIVTEVKGQEEKEVSNSSISNKAILEALTKGLGSK